MKNEDYPREIIPKKIKDSNIELVGVSHTKNFFQEYKNFFEEKIKESPEGIVLEQVVGGEFWEHPHFSKLGEIAYKNDIPVYHADTIKELHYAEFIIPLWFWRAIEKVLSETPNKKGAGKITKKEFLEKLRTYSWEKNIPQKSFISHTCINETEPFNDIYKFIYGQTDWRNVRIAKGIAKICKKENFEKLTAFHGAGHTEPIAFYLDNPKTRRIKNILYFPLNLCGEKGIRKYVPADSKENLDKYNQSWKLEKVL